MGRIDWSRWAPPDRDPRKEAAGFLAGSAAAAAVAWIWFLSGYWDALSQLYVWEDGVRLLRPNREMRDLAEIIGGSFIGLWAVLLWAVVTAALHYAGHYREGSRPVYLMRRLPDRWEYHRRCLAIPAAATVTAAALMLGFLGAFYGIYMSFTPAECIGPDQWQKIWRML